LLRGTIPFAVATKPDYEIPPGIVSQTVDQNAKGTAAWDAAFFFYVYEKIFNLHTLLPAADHFGVFSPE